MSFLNKTDSSVNECIAKCLSSLNLEALTSVPTVFVSLTLRARRKTRVAFHPSEKVKVVAETGKADT